MTFYALIQKGHIVLDIGETEDEALEYSLSQNESLEYTTSYNSANDSDLVLIECTEDLYNAIKEDSDALYEVINNIADIYNQ